MLITRWQAQVSGWGNLLFVDDITGFSIEFIIFSYAAIIGRDGRAKFVGTSLSE
jgi:hypothetical protein